MGEAEHSRSGFLDRQTREKIDAACEWGILGLVLAALVFSPLALGAVRLSEFVVVQFLTVGILALWLTRYWLGKTHRLLWTPVCWPAAAFVAYAVFRYAGAEIESVARQELVRVLVYATLFFAVLNNLHRQQPTRILALTLVGLGAALSFYALYQWLTHSEKVWHFLRPRCYFLRASGSYICPDHLAGLLLMLMPLALAYTLLGRFKTIPRVLLGYAALLMTVGLAVTVSYGAWLALAAVLAVFFWFLFRTPSHRLAAVVCIAILAVFSAIFYFASLRPRARVEQSQTVHIERTPWKGIWPATWRMWLDHPWLGVGPGHFDFRYRQYRLESPREQNRPGRAHNDYLNALADWGVVGAALVAAAWGALLWGVLRGWRFIRRTASDLNPRKSNKSAFVLGASLGLLGLLIEAFADFNFHIPANAMVAVTLMAMISSHLRFATDRFWVTQRRAGRALGTLVLGAAMVWLAGQGWKSARAQYWLGRAAAAGNASAQLAALEKAFAIDSRDSETAYAIGENLRQQSLAGGQDPTGRAADAIGWLRRAIALNPYDPYACLRVGQCVHGLGYPEEAAEWFDRALKLDPNSYYMLAHAGWHALELGRRDPARAWLEKSLRLKPSGNPLAEACLKRLSGAAPPAATAP